MKYMEYLASVRDELSNPVNADPVQQEEAVREGWIPVSGGWWEEYECPGMDEFSYRFHPKNEKIARAMAEYALTGDTAAYEGIDD
jgi:hypothetical protein